MKNFTVNVKALRSIVAVAVDCGYACRDSKELPVNTRPIEPEDVEACVIQVLERISREKPAPSRPTIYGPDGDTVVTEA